MGAGKESCACLLAEITSVHPLPYSNYADGTSKPLIGVPR